MGVGVNLTFLDPQGQSEQKKVESNKACRVAMGIECDGFR